METDAMGLFFRIAGFVERASLVLPGDLDLFEHTNSGGQQREGRQQEWVEEGREGKYRWHSARDWTLDSEHCSAAGYCLFSPKRGVLGLLRNIVLWHWGATLTTARPWVE